MRVKETLLFVVQAIAITICVIIISPYYLVQWIYRKTTRKKREH